MLRFLYKLNERSLSLKSTILSRCIRFSVRVIANTFLPVYYRLTWNSGKFRLTDRNNIIVSLTSFPQRIGKIWIVIESIFRQTLKPERIILWLSKNQFPKELSDLPTVLKKQRERGLEIRFVKGDIRSHKKYFYCFEEYTTSKVLLIDDDIIYSPTLIERTYGSFNDHSVVGNFGFYYKWDENTDYIRHCSSKEEGARCFVGSGGGTMYIPELLKKFLLPLDDIIELCPTADDIFLNGLFNLSELNVHLESNEPLITIYGEGVSVLSENGTIGDKNSKNADQMRTFINYCLTHFGRNPFNYS